MRSVDASLLAALASEDRGAAFQSSISFMTRVVPWTSSLQLLHLCFPSLRGVSVSECLWSHHHQPTERTSGGDPSLCRGQKLT